MRRTLLAAGFHEAIASTFCSAAEAALTAPQPGQSFRSAIRSAKKPAYCAPRSFPACSP